jgi:hypothetical protein
MQERAGGRAYVAVKQLLMGVGRNKARGAAGCTYGHYILLRHVFRSNPIHMQQGAGHHSGSRRRQLQQQQPTPVQRVLLIYTIASNITEYKNRYVAGPGSPADRHHTHET